MTRDLLYRESVAYHEAGHVVVAAALGMRLSRHGIHLGEDANGMSYYEYRKPKKFFDGPSGISRDHTLIALYAGLIAQRKFYPKCSVEGYSDDQNLIDLLVQEVDAEDFSGSASLTAQLDLPKESRKVVNQHWAAIKAVAKALWDTPDKPRNLNEPEPCWSQSMSEKMLDGQNIVEILRGFGIYTSLWDLAPE
jgi:hypothetical protein